MTTLNDTSGQAHPYWYEWFVGLIEVVKLLNPDEGIETVAFQVASIQGWDDVVVTHSKGKRFIQVKHTRGKNSLTFGDIVEVDDKGQSLLGNLFEGAKKSGLLKGNTELVLYTNRRDGSQWSTRQNGDRRPPLLEFWRWLKAEIEKTKLGKISAPNEYGAAWAEWIACFNGKTVEATRFLKRLEIRTKEDDLDGLDSRIRASLATAFGISEAQSSALFDALCRELRFWTTGHDGVTVEILSDALTIPPTSQELAPAPPPPTPFFPTRLPVAEQLQTELLDEDTQPVVFLTGEPGSGKTSAVSWLANRRTKGAFEGIIGIRFFCYEPIRPEQPFISPDASRVKPEELWFSLLAQLRRGLQGRLRELEVPLRNSFLSWKEARSHVIRLADLLGKELGRRFVISIDGIDHAARSAQVFPEQIVDFFESLPSPDAVSEKRIRLLIAGQPPEYYRESYPVWLSTEHAKVRRVDLPKLQQADIRSLLANSTTSIGPAQTDEAVRLIDELSGGNTLSIVFAVAEADSCSSLNELESRLKERSLGDGLSKYYESIWRHAIRDAKELSCSLAGAISTARTAVTAEKLSRIFFDWKKPIPIWEQVLTDLGPLLIRRRDGYFIRHNDVRIFLAAKFKSFDKGQRNSVVSRIADYFASKDSDRLAAHLQLFDLLKLTDRSIEIPGRFDVDWVLEGAAFGIEVSHLLKEGEFAVAELSKAKSWSSVVSVSCALDTLDRISEHFEHSAEIEPQRKELPPFLPSEASVRPFTQWTKNDFHRLVWDANELVERGAPTRAKGLLTRWLDGLNINRIVKSIPDLQSSHFHRTGSRNDPRLDETAESDFVALGSLSAKINWKFWGSLTKRSSRLENTVFYAFEKGFIGEVTKSPTAASLAELLSQHWPRFYANQELAIRNLAKAGSWRLVAEFLKSQEEDRGAYSEDFLLDASWYALMSGIPSESKWHSITREEKPKLPRIPRHYHVEDFNLAQFVNFARALGWTRSSLDAADIADIILEVFESTDEPGVENAMKLLFRTAAVLGRYEGYEARFTWDTANKLFTPEYIRQLLSALWGDVIHTAPYRFKGRLEASNLAETLTQYCAKLGGDFDNAVLEAALPFAEECVLGQRLNSVWNVVKRHGKLDVLRRWINKYISEKGIAWSWSPEEAKQTVIDLIPLARSIGMNDVADYGAMRARWLVVGYRSHKDYSFERVHDWFSDAARNDPAIWSNEGWKLWELCRICEEKDGDNRFESEVLEGISCAAIRSGKTIAWWRLISTTLPKKSDRNWHYNISQQFVRGHIQALAQGLTLSDAEILPIWSIALSLSYWFENSDTSSLLKLRHALLFQASERCKAEIENAMRSVSPIISLKGDDKETRSQSHSEQTRTPVEGPRDDDDWWKEIDAFLQKQKDETTTGDIQAG
jgi:hypothetical protein